MLSFWRQTRFALGTQRGFTLVELMIVVAIIGILAAIAVPLYANMQQRARIAKAQADIRGMASAVTAFSAATGSYPVTLQDLTATASNPQGQTAGPFMGAIPNPPGTMWNAYQFATNSVGLFTISASGDGVTVSAP